jgi:thiamine biosynthesis lipoprotein
MTRRVEQIMGMPIVIDVRDAHVPEAAIEEAFAWLRWVDETFSTYRDDSEIARLNRGELAEAACDPAVREVLAACRGLRERTGGAFDAEAAARMPAVRARLGRVRPGAVEPAGYVKGWAISGAWERLAAAGVRNAIVEAGGDMLVCGRAAPDRRWRVGIQHPDEDEDAALAAFLELSDLAVATSGAYRRGDHIVDPATGTPPRGVRSVTCVGRDVAVADALATAGYAMGADGAEWLARQPDVEALVICDDGSMRFTAGFDALRADSALSQVSLRVGQA